MSSPEASPAVAVSGMALSIRQAVDSETFDLAGCNQQTLQTLVKDAFGEPVVSVTGVPSRITLVTGAGKLGRQKYDASCAKIMTNGLMALGYVEDKGASAIFECSGTFKSQHDTNKNLKTVVVFPKVVMSGGSGGGGGGEGDLQQGPPLLVTGSPEYRIVMASNKNILERMMESKCQTWSQKKEAMTVMDDLFTRVQACDEKLMHGTPLTAVEQDFYDICQAPFSLANKQDVIRELMHVQVDAGKITALERNQLLHQVQERLQAMDKEVAAAVSENKPKLKEKLEQKRLKVLEREEKLQAIVPISPPPLKLQAEINKLRAEAVPLKQVQDAGTGRLLSVKESQTVSKLLELLDEIEVLEQDSRGWFEEDGAFDARLQASRRAATAAAAKKNSSKKTTKSASTAASSKSSLPSSAKWVTPGGSKKTTAAASKPKATRGGGVFGAMMMDSDSD